MTRSRVGARHDAALRPAPGRAYQPFDYVGAPHAERVVVIMGSGSEAVGKSSAARRDGHKIGVVKVRLFRPFSGEDFVAVLPSPVRCASPCSIASRSRGARRPALSRCARRPCRSRNASGSRIRDDIRTRSAAATASRPRSSRPRWSRRSLTSCAPAQQALHRRHQRRRHPASLASVPTRIEPEGTSGPCSSASARTAPSAPTRTPSRSSAKTDNYAQGYFVYDSKKAGTITVSHLRFGHKPIRPPT